MNTNSSNSSLLNAPSMHMEGWNAGVNYDTFDVRLSVSGGLFQIKGHPEGLHDVFMRIRDAAGLPSPLFPSGVSIVAATLPPPGVWIEDCECRVVEERADPRASFAGHVFETPWDRWSCFYFTGYAN